MSYALWVILGVVFLLVLFLLGFINHCSKEDPLSGLYFASRIYYSLAALRITYILMNVFLCTVDLNDWEFYLYQFYHDFGLDIQYSHLCHNNVLLDWSFETHVLTIFEKCVPVLHAEESYDLASIHPSFAVANDTSPGGLLVQKLLTNLISQEQLGLPMYLSPLGVQATAQLVHMVNSLPMNGDSNFTGDNLMFDYLNSAVTFKMDYNMALDLQQITPTISYTLPLRRQDVLNGQNAGVYAFIHDSGHVGIGSAMTCTARLQDHLRSFTGSRDSTFMHTWVKEHGGLDSLNWAPIITMPNLETVWMKSNSMDTLSAGADKVLQCITQYPTRIMEQCLLTQYRPYLNAEGKPYNVIFFNTHFSPQDMSVTPQSLTRYQALALDKVTVLAEAGSFNELAKYTGLSNVTVRNNVNWTQVVEFYINDTPTQGYLHQLGAPWRDTLSQGQLTPKQKWPTLDIPNIDLRELTPGKVYAINVDTMETQSFTSLRDMWLQLNPSKMDSFNNLTGDKQHEIISNHVGRYINVARPEGTSTDLGNFYFARHPDYLPNMAKSATSLYRVDVDTGLATWFANNSQVDSHDRLTVRKCLANLTLTRSGCMFVSAQAFTELFSDALDQPGSTYNLSLAQLATLPLPRNIDLSTSLFVISATGLATWYRNKSTVPNTSRQNVRMLMSNKKQSSNGSLYINAKTFLNLVPNATAGPGQTYQLTEQEMSRVQA